MLVQANVSDKIYEKVCEYAYKNKVTKKQIFTQALEKFFEEMEKTNVPTN